MSAPFLLHKSHEVLNPNFCSGYQDAFGNWNTGFPCPSDSQRFCCGTDTFKYCCTGQERATPAPVSIEDPLLLVLAITLGVAAGVTLLTLVACFVIPGCTLYKKRRPGPLYRLPCSSTLSSYAATSTIEASRRGQDGDSRLCGSASTNFAHCAPMPSIYATVSADPLCQSGCELLQQPSHHSHPQTQQPLPPQSQQRSRQELHQYQQLHQQHQQDLMSDVDQHQHQMQRFHQLCWNRTPPIHQMRLHQGRHHTAASLVSHYPRGGEGASPPPPYEANFQPPSALTLPATTVVSPATSSSMQLSSSTAAIAAGVGRHNRTSNRLRPVPQEAVVRHISPRQPALCIIEDARRQQDDPPNHQHHHHHNHQQRNDSVFRSTKF